MRRMYFGVSCCTFSPFHTLLSMGTSFSTIKPLPNYLITISRGAAIGAPLHVTERTDICLQNARRTLTVVKRLRKACAVPSDGLTCNGAPHVCLKSHTLVVLSLRRTVKGLRVTWEPLHRYYSSYEKTHYRLPSHSLTYQKSTPHITSNHFNLSCSRRLGWRVARKFSNSKPSNYPLICIASLQAFSLWRFEEFVSCLAAYIWYHLAHLERYRLLTASIAWCRGILRYPDIAVTVHIRFGVHQGRIQGRPRQLIGREN